MLFEYIRKIIFYTLLIILWSCSDFQPILKTGLEGTSLPSYNLLLMDSTTRINISQIKSENPLVLFYFSPNCSYCKAQTKEVIQDISLLQSIHIFMASSFPFTEIKNYYEDYKLKKYPSITVGQDYEQFFNRYFKPGGFPCFAIYGSDKKLNQVLLGKVKCNLIKDFALK